MRLGKDLPGQAPLPQVGSLPDGSTPTYQPNGWYTCPAVSQGAYGERRDLNVVILELRTREQDQRLGVVRLQAEVTETSGTSLSTPLC